MLSASYFNQDTLSVARGLLGKVIYHKYQNIWLTTQIIETEAYCFNDKASHSSLGYTAKRKPLFMPPGTIYMYYARGADSLCVSTRGKGNAILIKSGIVYQESGSDPQMLNTMLKLNPCKGTSEPRDIQRLCSGQTLLCRALNLKVTKWDGKQFDRERFFIKDLDYNPESIITAARLGITPGRDEHLPYRFIDAAYMNRCTKRVKLSK